MVKSKIPDRTITVSSSFVYFENDLRKSKAWAALTKTEMNIYFELRSRTTLNTLKRKGRGQLYIRDNKIKLVYSEAAKLGWPTSTFSRGIQGLERRGLIDLIRPGGGKRGVECLYAISNRWRDYGTPKFKKNKIRHIIPEVGRRAFIKMHRKRKAIKAINGLILNPEMIPIIKLESLFF